MAPIYPHAHPHSLKSPKRANAAILFSILSAILINTLVLALVPRSTPPPAPTSPLSSWLGSGLLRGLLEPEQVLVNEWERRLYLIIHFALLIVFFNGRRRMEDDLGGVETVKIQADSGVKAEEAAREKMLELAQEGVDVSVETVLAGRSVEIWEELGVVFEFVEVRAISPQIMAAHRPLLFSAAFCGFFIAHVASLPPFLFPLCALVVPTLLLWRDYSHLNTFDNLPSGLPPSDLLIAYLFSHPAALHELPRAHRAVEGVPSLFTLLRAGNWSARSENLRRWVCLIIPFLPLPGLASTQQAEPDLEGGQHEAAGPPVELSDVPLPGGYRQRSATPPQLPTTPSARLIQTTPSGALPGTLPPTRPPFATRHSSPFPASGLSVPPTTPTASDGEALVTFPPPPGRAPAPFADDLPSPPLGTLSTSRRPFPSFTTSGMTLQEMGSRSLTEGAALSVTAYRALDDPKRTKSD